MAVGKITLPTLHPISGIRLGVTQAGIRKKDRRDLTVVACQTGSTAAGVFTRNRFCAAPVIVARDHLGRVAPRALVINTGFANAGTGEAGMDDAIKTCDALANILGCSPGEVLPFSTGVIGERMPLARLIAGLPGCVGALSENGWAEAAQAIMTTDTVAKGSSRQIQMGGRTVTVTGIAKGSGMIRPDMATMLAFVGTDIAASANELHGVLMRAVDSSFNRITVDGDTSTNDACILVASGASGVALSQLSNAEAAAFQEAVSAVCTDLAQKIVRDGEGATKLISVDVTGAASVKDAQLVAYAVAHSPLVKTAFFASDPNWGRILAAVGRAGVANLDVSKVTIHLGSLCVVRHGGLDANYTEPQGAAEMKKEEITVSIDLASGPAHDTVWTCDFSYDYVRINAEYRS